MSLDDSESETVLSDPIKNDNLTARSKERYIVTYENFTTWRQRKNIDSLSEEVVLSYFEELSAKYKPTTLWAMYSMLKCGLKCNHDVNMENYQRVTALLKQLSKGFVRSKKVKALSLELVEKFIDEAPDEKYLATKVALILGVTGGLKGQDLTELTTKDIKRHGDIFLIRSPHTKKWLRGSFVVQGKHYDVVKKYQSLRVPNAMSTRFFLQFRDGKCHKQVIGLNRFRAMPKEIAEFLKLPDARSYSGYTFRSGSRMPADLSTFGLEVGEEESEPSQPTSRPKPAPALAPRRSEQQCRFCGDFKECAPVVHKPYLVGNKTTLALNHLRVELDFSIDSLPNTICGLCDAKLLETFEFIKQINSAQFSLVALCQQSDATNNLAQTNSQFEFEVDTTIVKAEFESSDEDAFESKEVVVDALTLGETVYLKETHKRKSETVTEKTKKKKKVKDSEIHVQNTELIIDIKEEVVDSDNEQKSDESDNEQKSDESDNEADVKLSEIKFESDTDNQRKCNKTGDGQKKERKKKSSSGKCND